MSENLIQNRMQCLDQADGFLIAAERVGVRDYPHIVYHLSLLALEEVGKASLIGGQLATGGTLEGSWMKKALENHRRKLQWAIWSPIDRIDPQDFEAAREFAERAHAMRLASLYVDAQAKLTDMPSRDVVQQEDAEQAFAIAQTRLEYERARGTPDPNAHETDDLLGWFLETMADPERSRQLLSEPFIAQYHAFDNDPRVWIDWARSEIIRLDEEATALLQSELAKPAAAIELSKPKWRASATVFTPSHSIRTKALNKWNAQIEPVQLLWSGKKDRFTLQITLNDNAPLASLSGRIIHLSKLVVACLNIASLGYFWFEQPGFERQMFNEIRDLENNARMETGGTKSFWDDDRAVVLTEEHIEHAVRCMMAFAPLSEEEAAPIFRPYYDGLALLAKSDMLYNFDLAARRAFVGCLAGALSRYGGWDGTQDGFRASFDEAFEPIMPEKSHRDQMFRALEREGDPSETPLVNLRSAKQLADLYLIQVGQRRWADILKQEKQE